MGKATENYLRRRLKVADEEATTMVEQLDATYERLAAVLNHLRQFDPAYVAMQLGEPAPAAAPTEQGGIPIISDEQGGQDPPPDQGESA